MFKRGKKGRYWHNVGDFGSNIFWIVYSTNGNEYRFLVMHNLLRLFPAKYSLRPPLVLLRSHSKSLFDYFSFLYPCTRNKRNTLYIKAIFLITVARAAGASKEFGCFGFSHFLPTSPTKKYGKVDAGLQGNYWTDWSDHQLFQDPSGKEFGCFGFKNFVLDL